ncbi:MAG TPA: penicillin-binding protein 2 [Actinomycetota bacterium]|nr:penicillin-binding protein 2 [Actinomycetota bacterium]
MTESKVLVRMKVLAGLIAFMFAALTIRLWYVQVLASDQFARMADDNQVRLVPVHPVRGEILDRKGRVLVGNRPSTVVVVDRRAMGDREREVLSRLAELLEVPVRDLKQRLNSVKYFPYQPIPVADDVPKSKVFYIAEHPGEFPGVRYETSPVRYYKNDRLAAHLLGHLGEVSPEQLEQRRFRDYRPGELVGQGGVEAAYERFLHGRLGTRGIQVNAQGDVLDDDFGGRPPEPGKNVVLSIDTRIQKLAESSLVEGIRLARRTIHPSSGRYLEATGGAVVVLDPRNGQILAMASSPSYDPAIFGDGLSTSELEALSDPGSHSPLVNRATQGLYPAGSTFKPFVAGAALREGLATMDGRYDCPGAWQVPTDAGRVFHNWDLRGRGMISLPESLVVSCDTVYYQFGYQFWLEYLRSGKEAEVFQKHLSLMGFGKPTGVDLPGEKVGRLPNEQLARSLYRRFPEVFGEYYGWLPGDSVNLSIGQGFLLVTPLQLAKSYAALANGGRLFEPRVGWRIETSEGRVLRRLRARPDGRLPLTAREIAFLRSALRGVPERGTAALAFAGFPLDRIPVAGKTGTADILPKQPYSWFAAMAPANDPKYVVVAMVEQGGFGATTAAPVVRRIFEGLFGLQPSDRLRAGGLAD